MMTLYCKDLIRGYKKIGLKPGNTVLVHSSLKSFGFVQGGAETVIKALIEAVGPEGSVMVPALTGKRTDSRDNPPIFDVRSTSCWTGRIPETFRQLPESKRSLHPTHSVCAAGGKKEWLTQGHETGQSPCDRKSPYYKNALQGGYIMLIGVDQNSNTTIHCCEEIAGVDYHLQNDFTDIYITGYEGEKILVRNRLHNWDKPPVDFNKFDELYANQGIMKIDKIGNSVVRLIKAGDMVGFSVEKLRKEPHFLFTEPQE